MSVEELLAQAGGVVKLAAKLSAHPSTAGQTHEI
jgi:hypothetical protein